MKNSFHIKNMNVVSPSYELVDVHVYLKGYFLFKRLLTLITCVRFLSSVYPRVSLEIVFVCETFHTECR